MTAFLKVLVISALCISGGILTACGSTPGDLNRRLTAADSFTSRGWLIWSGISKVTGGKAKARFYNEVSEDIINGCLRDGF